MKRASPLSAVPTRIALTQTEVRRAVPCALPPIPEPSIAITIGAGVQWLDVSTIAQQQNRTVAGGFVVNGSVGAGAGWSLGGGHSPLSPFYGLGMYNVALLHDHCH